MLYSKILKLAHQLPVFRGLLIPLLYKFAETEPSKWEQFLLAKYEGGHKKVPNPNPSTRAKYPEVTLETAIQVPSFFTKIKLEFLDWSKKAPAFKPKEPKTVSKQVTKKPVLKKPFKPSSSGWVEQSHSGYASWGDLFDFKHLTYSHKKAVAEYADSNYGDINKFARTGKNPFVKKYMSEDEVETAKYFAKQLVNQVKELDSALRSPSARVPTDVKVLRQVSKKHPVIKNILEGKLTSDSTFKDSGFVSTTLRQDFKWKEYSIHISVPKGARGLYLGNNSDPKQASLSPNEYEKELLLPRGVTFKVLSFDPKTKTVNCDLVPDEVSMPFGWKD